MSTFVQGDHEKSLATSVQGDREKSPATSVQRDHGNALAMPQEVNVKYSNKLLLQLNF